MAWNGRIVLLRVCGGRFRGEVFTQLLCAVHFADAKEQGRKEWLSVQLAGEYFLAIASHLATLFVFQHVVISGSRYGIFLAIASYLATLRRHALISGESVWGQNFLGVEFLFVKA